MIFNTTLATTHTVTQPKTKQTVKMICRRWATLSTGASTLSWGATKAVSIFIVSAGLETSTLTALSDKRTRTVTLLDESVSSKVVSGRAGTWKLAPMDGMVTRVEKCSKVSATKQGCLLISLVSLCWGVQPVNRYIRNKYGAPNLTILFCRCRIKPPIQSIETVLVKLPVTAIRTHHPHHFLLFVKFFLQPGYTLLAKIELINRNLQSVFPYDKRKSCNDHKTASGNKTNQQLHPLVHTIISKHYTTSAVRPQSNRPPKSGLKSSSRLFF